MNPINPKNPINREESLGSFSDIPSEMIKKIFSHLGLKELSRFSWTSKAFNVLANDPQLWKSHIAFGKEQWETYFGDVGVEPPLPEGILKILNSPCPFFENKKIRETHRLVLVPEKIGGEVLTLNKLRQLIQNPRNNGHATNYRFYNKNIQNVQDDKVVSQSYWVLMTKDVISNSKNKTYDEQKELIGRYEGYALPAALEAAICILMEHVVSGIKLFSQQSWTYTRCSEIVLNQHPVIVGGFSSDGLDVIISRYGYDSGGVGPLRRFGVRAY